MRHKLIMKSEIDSSAVCQLDLDAAVAAASAVA